MSVFEKLYTEKYKESDYYKENEKRIADCDFFNIYMTSLIDTFKWDGITQNIPRFEIEKFFQFGGTVGYRISTREIYPVFPAGSLLENGEYSAYTQIKLNGETNRVDRKDLVIGYNNCFKMPYCYLVNWFSEKSSYALRAVDSALEKATLPVIVSTDDESIMKKLGDLRDKEHLQAFLVDLKSKLNKQTVEVLHLFDNAKNDVLALWDVYVRYRNLFYTQIGINNVEIQKRERLTMAEGSGNDEIVHYSLLNDMYERRKEFVEECNKYGENFSVELNRDIATTFQLDLSAEEKVEYGKIEATKGANTQDGGESNEVQNNND